MFHIALYIAISLSLIGFLYQFYFFLKTNTRFSKKQEIHGRWDIKSLLSNTLFQAKLFKAGRLRWLIHFLMVSGFGYLLIFHALDDVTSMKWFYAYQSPVDPFQFLRNLAGLLVLAGCCGFLVRRMAFSGLLKKRKIHLKGLFTILLIFMVTISGFLLEAIKIMSEPVFLEMVEEYSDIDEDTGLEDLKIYWGKEYHVVFNEALHLTREKLDAGQELNQEFCIHCHSPVKSAFISRSITLLLKNTGIFLNHHRVDRLVYHVHYFLCLLMLVVLPFSRLFHLFLIPVASLEKNLTSRQLIPGSAHDTTCPPGQIQGYFNTATLWACTNCGFCSDVCSVTPNYLITQNIHTLPHSKIAAFKQLLYGDGPGPGTLFRLQAGNGDCTFCHNCTDICPSGIDLQNVWGLLDQHLAAKGFKSNHTFIESLSLKQWTESNPETESPLPAHDVHAQFTDHVNSFDNCIQCTICTNVCPVVEYDTNDNDFTPQQIMNLLRLGKKHLAAGTRMVWNCLACYACQEYCPQGIKVADIMMELRNNGNFRADAIQLENVNKAE